MMWQMLMIFLLTEFIPISSYTSNFTVSCERFQEKKTLRVRAGESLYLPCSNLDCYEATENTSYIWYKNLSKTLQFEQIGTEESEHVHYHESVLYILNLTTNDTGSYITRWWYSNNSCDEYEIDIVVYEEFNTNLLYSPMSEIKVAGIYCPVCDKQEGTFTWYKNFTLIPNQESGRILRIRNASKDSAGIYTCVCTWEHHGRMYNTSGSRELLIRDQPPSNPTIILLPVNSTMIADLNTEIVLLCSVRFGINVRDQCKVEWERNRTQLDGVDGYKQEFREVDGVSQSVLTISKVSQVDLQSEFHCRVEDAFKVRYVSVTLKSRVAKNSQASLALVEWDMVMCLSLGERGSDEASVLLVVLPCISMFLLLLVSETVKWFAVDLLLFLRGIFTKLNRKEDGKVYDAYVIYQRNSLDEMTAKTLSDFVNGALPTVLERYYGFKLYIHGRDDLPGEDSINLIETKIQLSRRLIFILTPGTSVDQSDISPEAYDLQVGLHQALVQGDMGVILIQLGETQDYTHLPLGLQHLLHKNSPLMWREEQLSPNSRFWKQVRYRMPVPSSCQRNRKINIKTVHSII
ncbi:interleukin-1 receptor-like 1 isoform X1 [Myxocyprinus asiaticus]|uniref:interleukin-1 receptor-like 1 isoform X1 n=1 Tax=Myxocyprinus asiaticus TaxID=70543 RepID=UPI002223BB01|nr:interleukin-1 receptor-like 1 isoform X1 [Myxocyprinus asiaticus]XP_051564210.1 interleukin-1 receptor-like 1 isoform X1 [Myxocyprinus asiaticus]